MPIYKLLCKQCHKQFEAFASVSERTNGAIACPDCGGKDHEAVYEGTANIHVRQSADEPCPHAHCCSGACGCH